MSHDITNDYEDRSYQLPSEYEITVGGETLDVEGQFWLSMAGNSVEIETLWREGEEDPVEDEALVKSYEDKINADPALLARILDETIPLDED
jgi:hypothetical protein